MSLSGCRDPWGRRRAGARRGTPLARGRECWSARPTGPERSAVPWLRPRGRHEATAPCRAPAEGRIAVRWAWPLDLRPCPNLIASVQPRPMLAGRWADRRAIVEPYRLRHLPGSRPKVERRRDQAVAALVWHRGAAIQFLHTSGSDASTPRETCFRRRPVHAGIQAGKTEKPDLEPGTGWSRPCGHGRPRWAAGLASHLIVPTVLLSLGRAGGQDASTLLKKPPIVRNFSYRSWTSCSGDIPARSSRLRANASPSSRAA